MLGINIERTVHSSPHTHGNANKGVAMIFAKRDINGNIPNIAAENGRVTTLEDSVRATGSPISRLKYLGASENQDSNNEENSTIPSVEPAERNKETDIQDMGSSVRKAIIHNESEFNVMFRLLAIPEERDSRTMIAALIAEIGIPENAR